MYEFPYTEPISEYIQGYQIGFEDGKTTGAKEFAEFLLEFSKPRDITIISDLGFIKENGVETYKPKFYSVDEILAEYEKEQKNEN